VTTSLTGIGKRREDAFYFGVWQDVGLSLYGASAHNFVVREFEIGHRAALAEDEEHAGFGPLLDLAYHLFMLNTREALELLEGKRPRKRVRK